jgi:hypothetical protein
MQRSSNRVGTLAAALAKAQSEIVNPEKSLTATIELPGPRQGQRTFRYAPLSTGLDTVRKCLGQHEIATIQATAIDRDTGLIKLTTTLVHASGEWVSSDWPVCPVSETATPHRMGAALTYARRYALFTLVGIAGEDDLDSPDLAPDEAAEPGRPNAHPEKQNGSKGVQIAASSKSLRARNGTNAVTAPVLSPKASAALRDQLLVELERLKPGEAMDPWALDAWPKANTLIPEDGDRIRTAFQARMAGLTSTPGDVPPPADPAAPVPGDEPRGRIDKSVLALPAPKRLKNKQHLRFVAKQPCLVCGREPSDPHHLRFAQPRGLGQKVSDEFTVPLCRAHHRELHRAGTERDWWSKNGLEPLESARRLWKLTQSGGRGEAIEVRVTAGQTRS